MKCAGPGIPCVDLHPLPSWAVMGLPLGLERTSGSWAAEVSLLWTSISQSNCVHNGVSSPGLAFTQAPAEILLPCPSEPLPFLSLNNLCVISSSRVAPNVRHVGLRSLSPAQMSPLSSRSALLTFPWTALVGCAIHPQVSFSKLTLLAYMAFLFSAYLWTSGSKLGGRPIKETLLTIDS